MKSAIGTRGKETEKQVKLLLEEFNKRSDFAYDRQPDARAAGGHLKAAICDFIVWFKSGDKNLSVLLEVKETQHDYRLTRDKVSQLPRMKKVVSAGAYGYIIVYHSTIKKWRIININDLEFGVPSWDLRGLSEEFDTVKDAWLAVFFRAME